MVHSKARTRLDNLTKIRSSITWISSWGEYLIILVICFTPPVNPFIACSGISHLRRFPWDRSEFSDYARLQNWKWIIPRNLPNRLFYSKQNILKLIFSKRLRLHIFESIRTGLKFLLLKAKFCIWNDVPMTCFRPFYYIIYTFSQQYKVRRKQTILLK